LCVSPSLFKITKLAPGANPITLSFNASVVIIYSATT
jgi:hypothetical protein